jgi:hypothetical protein
MANDLLIKINADAKNAKKEFDNLKEQTEDLEQTLNKVALISAAAFAAFTAEIFFSVKAFEEARKSSVELSNALQNQGIFTEQLKHQYDEYADAVQAATGVDNDAVSKAQAVAQTFLGQTKITKDLTFAIADLGASMGGDLNGAAEKIARTIGTGTNAFARQGLVIREGATEAERYAKVLEFVQAKAGGLAEEMNKADGFSKALTTSFGNLQEAIGARFAPVVAAGRKVLISFFDAISEHPVLTDLAVSLITAGAAVAGIIALVAAGVPIFLGLSAAVTALGLSLSVAFVGIPLLIGAVIAGVTLLALNWDKAMAGLRAAATATVTLLTELFGGLGKVLSGAFTLDRSKIAEGLNQIAESFKKSKDVAVATYTEITDAQAAEGEKQNAQKKALADKQAAIERQHQANLRAIRQAELDLLRLQTEHASADLIDLKSKEIEVLKALDAQKSDAEIALFRQRRDELRGLEDQANAEDIQRATAFAELMAATKADFAANDITIDAQLRADKLTALRDTSKTEADIDRDLQETLLTQKTNQRNAELLDRKKYGATAATINKALNSDEVQGTKSATGELLALQQSKNATLKSIGKAAAVANITISTAESAMNIYRGFSTIPIVGPSLGIIGAAAAVAFGAERIATVVGAADGGLITGGVPGRDSVPAMLMPGELVVPKKNFNEVVGAVQGGGVSGENSQEMIALLQSIDTKFSNPRITQIQGDIMTDDSYIDALVRKISDAIEFRNAQVFGVTT